MRGARSALTSTASGGRTWTRDTPLPAAARTGAAAGARVGSSAQGGDELGHELRRVEGAGLPRCAPGGGRSPGSAGRGRGRATGPTLASRNTGAAPSTAAARARRAEEGRVVPRSRWLWTAREVSGRLVRPARMPWVSTGLCEPLNAGAAASTGAFAGPGINS